MKAKSEKAREKVKNTEKTKSKAIFKTTPKFRFTIIAIILIAIFSFAITPVTLQNDTFYTIKIGEHIQNVGIDGKDPFSWHEDLAYTYPHWLYDLITYWIYAGFGMQGIYVTTCILSCILGISIFIVNKKLVKNNDVCSFFITIGVMYLLRPYIAARAQLVTFILFIWTIFFIEKFLNTKKIRYAVPLIIIPILIANLHVAVWPFYFVLYLPYIAEYLIAIFSDFVLYDKAQFIYYNMKINYLEKKQARNEKEEEKLQKLKETVKERKAAIDKVKIKREQTKKNPYKIKIVKKDATKWLIIIFIICIFTGLLTPLGDTPYTYLIKTYQGNTLQNINEHLPMTLANETAILCTFVILLAILVFTKAKIRLSDLFMLSGLLYLMLASKRQLTMFAMIGGIILNRLLADDFKNYDINPENILKYMAKPVISVLIIASVVWMSIYYIKPQMDDEYVSKSSYPVAACDFILENVDLTTAKFYNEYNYGSYLLFRGIPVFIDSRADLYTPEFSGKEEDIFSDFLDTSSIGTFYEDTFEKYGITHVICYKNSKMNMIITKTNDPKLTQIYGDDNFVVYERISNE